jgi:hypothetical protein
LKRVLTRATVLDREYEPEEHHPYRALIVACVALLAAIDGGLLAIVVAMVLPPSVAAETPEA